MNTNTAAIAAAFMMWLTNRSSLVDTNNAIPTYDIGFTNHYAYSPWAVQVVLNLNVVTNWTGYTFQGKELGYVATNHDASIGYQGATNTYTLKTTTSDQAVWRDSHAIIWTTNAMPIYIYNNTQL